MTRGQKAAAVIFVGLLIGVILCLVSGYAGVNDYKKPSFDDAIISYLVIW